MNQDGCQPCLLKKEYVFYILDLHVGLDGRRGGIELGCDLRSGVEESSIDFDSSLMLMKGH